MQEVKRIFDQLKSTSSTNEKKEILKQNKDNEQFTATLKWLLNPYIVTGISEKKLHKQIENEPRGFIAEWGRVMEFLTTHNTGKDLDIKFIQNFIKLQPEDMKELYEQLVTKSLKVGVDAKTVNTVIPDLIPTFNVQLGTGIEKCKLKEDEWFSLSRKINGNRCVYVNGALMSRQGKEFTGLEHIISDIQQLGFKDIVYDGELVGRNEEGLSDSENFQKSTGIANSKSDDKSSLKLVIFDVLPLKDFQAGKSEATYRKRKEALNKLRDRITERDLFNIEVVEMVYEGADINQIWKYLNMAEQNDWEGLMLNYDSFYECKRTKNLIKIKKFFDIDLRCITINKATTGKYKDTLGSITCKFNDNTVDVGSGFSDDQRHFYFKNPNELVGKIVTVKYKEVTQNKNGGESLQFPVFVTVRADKDTASDEE